MSPVSRGRKRQQQKRTRGRPGATRPAPSKGELLDGMLRTFQKTVRATDPLEAETLASGILGALREQLPHGEDAEATIGMELVDQVAHARTPRAVALLRALAAVGTTGPLRAAARSAAEELVAGGVADPLWAAAAGRVDVGECWRLGDVYGDQASLLCTFGTGTRPHGLLALLDFNHLDGWVKDVFVTDDPAGALRSLREAAASEPLATLEPIDPAAARLLLEDGFAATDITWQPEVSDEFRQYRALALARCRAIPAPAKPAAEDQEIDEAEREAIVAEFLASPQGGALPADDATRFCARLLVDYGADYGSAGPLRVSPARTEAFLHDWLPRKAVLDDADRAAFPAVVTAWVRWAGERAGLPDEALVELVGVATECGGHFDEAYEEGAGSSPARLFLQGLDPGAGLAEVQDALDRRMFTMPFFGTRIGDEDFPSLDPGDPDERRLLIEGEHPEYHDALDDPLFDGELDGVNPRLHLAMHEVAANQLWDDDPPEAWRAAKRLQAAGVDRHEILHQLTWVAAEHLHGALSSKQSVDPEAYAAALDALRPPASVRARCVRARGHGRHERRPAA
jgi:Domain of unknown function (DUF1841)